MLNFLRAEFWRYFRRPAGKALMILSLGLPAALNVYVWLCNIWLEADSTIPYTLADSLGIGIVLMPYAGIFLLMAIVDVAFADEKRLSTVKNSLSAGIPRGVLYSGKIISGLLLAFFHLGAAWASALGTGVLLLPLPEEADLSEIFRTLGNLFAEVIPLWLGALGVLYLLYFCFRNGLAAALAVAVGSFFLSVVLLSLNFPFAEFLAKMQFFTLLMEVLLDTGVSSELSAGVLVRFWLAGGGYFAGSVLLGWIFFRRHDLS